MTTPLKAPPGEERAVKLRWHECTKSSTNDDMIRYEICPLAVYIMVRL